MILTTGGMEVFSKCFDTFGTFSLICCMFWIFSPAEGQTMSGAVGSRVVLPCVNKSVSNITQLTWKKDGVTHLTFLLQKPLYISPAARWLKINMSVSESQQYALIIETAQMNHTGNYTCEITTANGNRKQTWELKITDHVAKTGENWNIMVIAVAVPCVCVLILTIALATIHRVCKRCAENRADSNTAEMEPPEHIYENRLEINARQQHGYNQRNKSRAS